MDMDGRPLVSVGIPTYNRASHLVRALESVLAQDYPSLEVILSDNASTDETEQVGRDYAARDPRVKYFRQTINLGLTRNFLEAFQKGHGPYFMWLADDDWLDPGYITACVTALESDPGLVLAAGRARSYREGEIIGDGVLMNLDQTSPAKRLLRYYAKVGDNGTFYGVGRRAAMERMTFVNTIGGDWLCIASLAYQGQIRTLEQVRVHRQLGGASSSRTNIAKTLGLPWFQARFTHLAIALSASRDVAFHGLAYADRSRFPRIRLALRVFLQLLVSKVLVQNLKSLAVWAAISVLGKSNYKKIRGKPSPK